jgi:hypothetical protein
MVLAAQKSLVYAENLVFLNKISQFPEVFNDENSHPQFNDKTYFIYVLISLKLWLQLDSNQPERKFMSLITPKSSHSMPLPTVVKFVPVSNEKIKGKWSVFVFFQQPSLLYVLLN